jgi:transcriptional regulator with XRE-family HTH domain
MSRKKSPQDHKTREKILRILEDHKSRKEDYKDLAKRIGLSASAITMWRKGKRIPDHKSIEIIAKSLGIPIENLSLPLDSEDNS